MFSSFICQKTAARFLLVFFFFLSLATTSSAISPDDQAARQAAFDWLALVDAGHYAKAYESYPPRVRTERGEQRSLDWFRTRRLPLGRTRSRTFLRVNHTHTLIGAPDGNYQQIVFKTSFDRKANGAEGLVVTKETGRWQVSGYGIK